jgi:hypothetical protein
MAPSAPVFIDLHWRSEARIKTAVPSKEQKSCCGEDTEKLGRPAVLLMNVRADGRVSFHPFPLWLEESSSLGSGGIFGRATGGSESGLETSLFRVSARPRKPMAIKIAPPIISQCGNSIDESKPIYFRFAFSHAFPAVRLALYSGSVTYRSAFSLPGKCLTGLPFRLTVHQV